jgi:hypothetical protein
MATQQQNYAAAGYELSLLLNPSRGGNSQAIVNQIQADTNSNFNTSFSGAETASNGLVTYGRMIGRNMSLSDSASKLTENNNSKKNNIIKERDTYTRQGEINEWQAQNKLDTLFFLQILFIFFLLVFFIFGGWIVTEAYSSSCFERFLFF